jgi:IS30 family transposase
VDRPPSTISRELKRNKASKGYRADYAEQQSRARRWTGCKLERDDDLREMVLGRLEVGWSPEQVAGRLKRDHGRQVISYETIYRFTYAQIRRTNGYAWRRYLPRGKSKRGRYGRRGGSPVTFIKKRRPISERPQAAADRKTPGHWESDYMLFKQYGHNILVAHERTSRLILLAKPRTRRADTTVRALTRLLSAWPEHMRSTITFDNGTEFARHYRLANQLGIQTFFCDPHAPWQKGGVENAIGRLRRYLPRKTDISQLSAAQLYAIAQRYNNTPRKCLGFKTPAEAIRNQLLHFKCESTLPLSRE